VNGSCLQVLQTRDWHRVVIYAPANNYRRASPLRWAVRPVANILRESQSPTRREVRLVQVSNFDPGDVRLNAFPVEETGPGWGADLLTVELSVLLGGFVAARTWTTGEICGTPSRSSLL
jgi:hypothetical protein